MPAIGLVRRYALPLYFILTYLIAWIAILLLVGPNNIPASASQIEQSMAAVLLAMLAGPSVAGLLMTALSEGRGGLRRLAGRLRRWRVARRWYAVALLTTPILLSGILLALSWKSPAYLPGIMATSARSSLILFALVGGLASGFFEELGWTGFATPRMQRRFGVLIGGLLLGVVWMLWHALADYWGSAATYGAWYWPHLLLWLAALSAYRVLMGWVYSQTGSLMLSQLMHASFTGSQILLGPQSVSAGQNIMWYAIFAASLWLMVAILASKMRASRPQWQTLMSSDS